MATANRKRSPVESMPPPWRSRPDRISMRTYLSMLPMDGGIDGGVAEGARSDVVPGGEDENIAKKFAVISSWHQRLSLTSTHVPCSRS